MSSQANVKQSRAAPETRARQRLEATLAGARALSESLPYERKQAIAQTFCEVLVRRYWETLQRPFLTPWSVPQQHATRSLAQLDSRTAHLAEETAAAAAQLDTVEAGYLIGRIYAAMLPSDLRARLGAYYTPPALAERLLTQATQEGVDWKTCRVLDPACGGGAFLAPVARRMAAALRGVDAQSILRQIAQRLAGLEIDAFAAWLSQVFVEATLLEVSHAGGERLPTLVTVGDSLENVDTTARYDLVIGNPPYGRTRLDSSLRRAYARSLFGHANLYGLFTDLALRHVRDGGVVSYVTPTSFLGGEYFKRLRRLLALEAPPVCVEFISARKGVFDEVLQETLLASYRRGGRSGPARVALVVPRDGGGGCEVRPIGMFTLPASAEEPWIVPRAREEARLADRLRRMPHRLRDWGYTVSTGPLVWNRHKTQLRSREERGCVPLIWAEAVTIDGRFAFKAQKKNHTLYFKPRSRDSWLLVREPCVLLQRTTAKEQARRLIATVLPKAFLESYGSVTIENHLNMLRPKPLVALVSPAVLAAFLNSGGADRAFRCLSGSVAVSAFELESLPLPSPDSISDFVKCVLRRAGRAELEAASARLYGLDV